VVEPYEYDAHGNTTAMPHLSLLRWNHLDQLDASSRQVVTDGTAETTYHRYDGAGQRVRTVTERGAPVGGTPTRMTERRYLGAVEIYREYDGAGLATVLERETLHVLDDQDRVAMVETRTAGDDGSAARLVRHQLADHLGSSSLELDDAGAVISYEEFHPYGSTSYEAVDASLGAAAKRYRYTGKERDDETGLTYHGARYYAPWLARWTSCDPAGLVDSTNMFEYVRGNPLRYRDPTGMAPAGAATGLATRGFQALRAIAAADAVSPDPTDVAAEPKVAIYAIAAVVLGLGMLAESVAPLPSAVQLRKIDQSGGTPQYIDPMERLYPRWATEEQRRLIDSGRAAWSPESGWNGPLTTQPGNGGVPFEVRGFAVTDPRYLAAVDTTYTSEAHNTVYQIGVKLTGTGNFYDGREAVGYEVHLVRAQFTPAEQAKIEERNALTNEQIQVYREHDIIPVAIPSETKDEPSARRLGDKSVTDTQVDEALPRAWDGIVEAENQIRLPANLNGMLGRADTAARDLAVEHSGYGTPLEYVRIVWR
jgi:RHS repeat-associated protein